MHGVVRGMHDGGGVCMAGGHVWWGGGHVWQGACMVERQLLKQVVRILLECILGFSVFL